MTGDGGSVFKIFYPAQQIVKSAVRQFFARYVIDAHIGPVTARDNIKRTARFRQIRQRAADFRLHITPVFSGFRFIFGRESGMSFQTRGFVQIGKYRYRFLSGLFQQTG